MENNDSEIQLSKEELLFNDFMRRGDDFMRINIYRNAKECYKEALDLHINDNLAKEKLEDCSIKIKKESKIIVTIIIIAVVIAGAVIVAINM